MSRSLKVARILKGLTQHELSQLTGITEAKLCRFETLRAEMSDDEARDLGRVLGVDPGKLKAKMFGAGWSERKHYQIGDRYEAKR